MSACQIRKLHFEPDAQALFARLRPLTGSFLLYSGTGFESASFDILGALPDERLRLDSGASASSLSDAIRHLAARLSAIACAPAQIPLPGWYGLAAYGAGQPAPAGDSPVFDAGFYPALLVVDRRQASVFLVWLDGYESTANALLAQLDLPAPVVPRFTLQAQFQANMDQAGYCQRFDRVQAYLQAGDCYQVNLAQRFAAAFQGDPWQAFATLTRALPAPMTAFFDGGDYQVLSLSPERFLSIRAGQVRTHPIKGTRPRLSDPDQDRLQILDLQHSEKDRAENLMIVDLLRNDLGISCLPGTVRVNELFAIESYANVHHMVSHIEGQLRPDIHPLQAFWAAFPGGSITGAPKKRAMEIIAELEPDSRRFYCGSAFYCDAGGRLDSSILIRSLLCEGGQVYCWGGGGIVVDSTADAEYQETLHKVGIILRTLEALPGAPET